MSEILSREQLHELAQKVIMITEGVDAHMISPSMLMALADEDPDATATLARAYLAAETENQRLREALVGWEWSHGPSGPQPETVTTVSHPDGDMVWIEGKRVMGRIGLGVMLSLSLYVFPEFYTEHELWQRN